jgi:hypothetical protein
MDVHENEIVLTFYLHINSPTCSLILFRINKFSEFSIIIFMTATNNVNDILSQIFANLPQQRENEETSNDRLD